MLGRVSGHKGEQQKNAVLSASKQDLLNPSRDPLNLLRRQPPRSNGPRVLQPTEQAKFSKRSGGVGTTIFVAVASIDEATTHACGMQRYNASRLTIYLGDGMVARRDAPMVRKGDHIGQVPNGCDDRCCELRLGS